MAIKKFSRAVLDKYLLKIGYKLLPVKESYPFYMSQEFIDLYEACKPYTMCNIFKLYSVYEALQYIIKNNVEGDIVETGVWRGGGMHVYSPPFKKMEKGKKYLFI